MPALIPELVNMASDPSVTPADLLRRALVAAQRLQLPEWASWIERELDGYGMHDPIPAYRHVEGEVLIETPHGTQVLHFPSATLAAKWQLCTFDTPIEEIQGWCMAGDDIHMRFSPQDADTLSAISSTRFMPLRRFTLASMRRIIGAVRNEVLRWALQLEKEGILGEGMSFTQKEQQHAQQLASVTIHIEGGFHGGQLMAGSSGGLQQQTVTCVQKEEALASLLPWLAQVIEQGQLQQEACDELQANHAALQALATSPKPFWPAIGALAGSVRAILESAGGGVLAGQALSWLATLSAS